MYDIHVPSCATFFDEAFLFDVCILTKPVSAGRDRLSVSFLYCQLHLVTLVVSEPVHILTRVYAKSIGINL